jgi:hypothetical protein
MDIKLSLLKQQFSEQVTTDSIKYDWDGGHSYSYIDHPLMSVEFTNQDDQDEWELFTNDWLYENDNCPPCQLEIFEGRVCSMCGCHDHLDYNKDREEVEEIINELMNYN